MDTSVCVPVYNGEAYIEECLRSILLQDYKNFELVISDDNSTDRSVEIINQVLNEMQAENAILVQNTNRGIGENWNNSIRHSSGQFIKLVMQDDVLKPDCLSAMRKGFVTESTGLVFCRRSILVTEGFDEEYKNYTSEWLRKFSDLHACWSGVSFPTSGRTLLKNPEILTTPMNKIGEPTCVMFKASIVDQIGFYSEEMPQSLDVDFWYRALTCTDTNFIDRELALFRLHDKQATYINYRVSAQQDTNKLYRTFHENGVSRFFGFYPWTRCASEYFKSRRTPVSEIASRVLMIVFKTIRKIRHISRGISRNPVRVPERK